MHTERTIHSSSFDERLEICIVYTTATFHAPINSFRGPPPPYLQPSLGGGSLRPCRAIWKAARKQARQRPQRDTSLSNLARTSSRSARFYYFNCFFAFSNISDSKFFTA
eukprot:2342269-Pleurochrysis_carterae.AAC.1